MPQTITKLRVFLSSPSNLDAERGVVAKVLDSLSGELSDDRGIVFSVFDWKRDAIPGISSNTQSVISDQLDYDIYIGILGTVFGTPTAQAGSGTEQEFNEAYCLYKKAPAKVRVLFYFNKTSSNVFQIDPQQLSTVLSFRSQLGVKGVLYHDFANLDALRDDVRNHIRALIRTQWDGTQWTVSTSTKDPTEISLATDLDLFMDQASVEHAQDVEVKDKKLGLLELVMDGSRAAEDLGKHFNRMIDLAHNLTEAIQTKAQLTTEAISKSDVAAAKVLYDEMADEIRHFQIEMQPELSIYDIATKEILQTFSGISVLFFDEHTGLRQELESILSGFEGLVESQRNVRATLQHFNEILERIPSLTTKLRASKKYLARLIDDFVSSYTLFLGIAEDLILRTKRRLAEINSSTQTQGT